MGDTQPSFKIDIPKRRHLNKRFELNDSNITVNRQRKLKRLVMSYDIPKRNPFSFSMLPNDASHLALKKFMKCAAKKKRNLVDLPQIQHVTTSSEPKDDVKTITQIDNNFFKLVDGRPLVHHIPCFKSLKVHFNELLRLKIEIGYRQNDILNIYYKNKKEIQEYNESNEICSKQISQLALFVSQDYEKSMIWLQKGADMKFQVDDKIIELYYLANQQYSLTSKIISLYYKYKLQQKYGRFLYYLSPTPWRSKHRDFARSIEIKNLGFDLGETNDNDVFSVIYENVKIELYTSNVRPAIYFEDPSCLLEQFVDMEQHYAHDFYQLMQFNIFTKNLNDCISDLKHRLNVECANLSNLNNKYGNLLDFLDKRCVGLKAKFYKILNNEFYDCVASAETLKLNLHLRHVYEKITMKESAMNDIVSLTKNIEAMYVGYCKQLDLIKSGSVRDAVRKCVKKEKEDARKAEIAYRELRQSRRLEESLMCAIEPKKVVNRATKFATFKLRKANLNIGKRKTSNNERILTEAEKEYLWLFTDWCNNDNPEVYLQEFYEHD